jgi:hypothetical protein
MLTFRDGGSITPATVEAQTCPTAFIRMGSVGHDHEVCDLFFSLFHYVASIGGWALGSTSMAAA